jgi:predicted HicB family RNase H-like nuclease
MTKQHNNINKASNKAHTAQINFFLHKELHEALKEAAKVRSVPVSRLCRQAIDNYLETEL